VVTVTGDASGEASGEAITISAQSTYDLPDNYGGIEGGFSYRSSSIYTEIKVISERQIRLLQQQSDEDATGYMEYCAIRPKSTDGATGQRFEVVFYPCPNSTYTLEFQDIPLIDALSETYPYPWGGEPHTETILASCLAVAEERLEDGRGEKYQYFMERLNASIAYDVKANTPETLGYCGDGDSDLSIPVRINQTNVVSVV